MKIDAYIQARMGSNRLPNKTNMMIGDKTLLKHVIDRVKTFKDIDNIVILTSSEEDDNIIDEIASSNNIDCMRDNNVIKRFIKAADKYNPDWVIRVCADSPLLDTELNNYLIDTVKIFKDTYDYIAFKDKVYPSITGLISEAYKTSVLKKRYELIQEHVTYHMYDHSNNYYIEKPKILKDNYFRVTVDTKEDYKFICELYNKIKNINYIELVKIINEKFNYRVEEEK